MIIVDSSVEIIPQEVGVTGIYKMIELAGRTAYKSEDKITEGSAVQFVSKLQNLNHGAALEHGTVYLKVPINAADNYLDNPFTVCKLVPEENKEDNWWAITTNYRVLVECKLLDDLKFLCDPTEHHEKRITVKFILSRGIANEFVRHRVFSFLQESTRYCNYSKDKFPGVTFIATADCPLKPGKYKLDDDTYTVLVGDDNFKVDIGAEFCELSAFQLFAMSYLEAEISYFELLKKGIKPQSARDILPLGLKTELIMTGTESQWDGFFKLRCAPNAHPDARKLAIELRNLMDIH